MTRRHARAGFTLVELLVTLSLMTVIFGVLFSMMSGGLQVWQRLQCGVRQEHEIYFALDQVRRGLHAAHPFEFILFKGSNERLEFPALIEAGDTEEEDRIPEPGRVSYYFDRSRSLFCKSERLYRGLRRNTRAEVCKPLAQNVEKVKFTYTGYNSKSENLSTSGYWSDKVPPISVRIELEYHDPCSEKQSKKEFLVSIPIGPIR